MIKKIKGPMSRVISAGTLFFFVVSNSAWGLPVSGISLMPSKETPGFLQIEIPPELASIEEVYEAPPKPDPRLILHIQNLHGNESAQTQIKKLLGYLYEKYGFKMLFVEGAVEELNPEYLRLFPDKERNIKLAEALVKQGELTGVEFYLVDGPKDVRAIGIEKADLYRANYEAFRKVYGAKTETDRFLGAVDGKLETLSSRIFPAETRRILSEWKKFEAGHREFLPFVKRLAQDSKRVLGLDLESLFAQVEWPQITRLLVIQAMEKDLNRVAAKAEQARLVEFLKTKQISPEIIAAIEKLGDKKITMARKDDPREKLENLPRYLFERLVEEAGPKGFYFHNYPAFSLWAGHLILESEIDSKTLFDEIHRVFEKILTELAATEPQKNLLELYQDSELLRKLYALEVSRKQWERVLYRREWIEPKTMTNRLEKIALSFPHVFRRESTTGSPTKTFGDDKSLSSVFITALEFYDFARKREDVFYETIEREMTKNKTDKAVLVTGGFHTDGIMEKLREREINYSVLMPRISGDLSNGNYVSAMLENRQTMFNLATLENILITLEPKYQKVLGRTTDASVQNLIERVIRVNFEDLLKNDTHPTDPASVVSYLSKNVIIGFGYRFALTRDRQAVAIFKNGQPYRNTRNNKARGIRIELVKSEATGQTRSIPIPTLTDIEESEIPSLPQIEAPLPPAPNSRTAGRSQRSESLTARIKASRNRAWQKVSSPPRSEARMPAMTRWAIGALAFMMPYDFVAEKSTDISAAMVFQEAPGDAEIASTLKALEFEPSVNADVAGLLKDALKKRLAGQKGSDLPLAPLIEKHYLGPLRELEKKSSKEKEIPEKEWTGILENLSRLERLASVKGDINIIAGNQQINFYLTLPPEMIEQIREALQKTFQKIPAKIIKDNPRAQWERSLWADFLPSLQALENKVKKGELSSRKILTEMEIRVFDQMTLYKKIFGKAYEPESTLMLWEQAFTQQADSLLGLYLAPQTGDLAELSRKSKKKEIAPRDAVIRFPFAMEKIRGQEGLESIQEKMKDRRLRFEIMSGGASKKAKFQALFRLVPRYHLRNIDLYPSLTAISDIHENAFVPALEELMAKAGKKGNISLAEVMARVHEIDAFVKAIEQTPFIPAAGDAGHEKWIETVREARTKAYEEVARNLPATAIPGLKNGSLSAQVQEHLVGHLMKAPVYPGIVNTRKRDEISTEQTRQGKELDPVVIQQLTFLQGKMYERKGEFIMDVSVLSPKGFETRNANEIKSGEIRIVNVAGDPVDFISQMESIALMARKMNEANFGFRVGVSPQLFNTMRKMRGTGVLRVQESLFPPVFIRSSALSRPRSETRAHKNVEDLITGLKDKDWKVQLQAAEAIAQLGPDAKEAIPALMEVLKQGISSVTDAAAKALFQIGADSIPPLIQALQSKISLRMNAVKALGLFGAQAKDALPFLIEDYKLEKKSRSGDLEETLVQIGQPVVPYMIEFTQDPDWEVRLRAIEMLAKIGSGSKEALPRLIEIFKSDKKNYLRAQSAQAIQTIDPQTAQTVVTSAAQLFYLMEAMKEGTPVGYTAWELGEMGPAAKAAVPYLIEALRNKKNEIESAVVRALGKIGPEAREAVPPLIEALKESEGQARVDIALALGGIGPDAKKAVPFLLAIMNDEDATDEYDFMREAVVKIDPSALPSAIAAYKMIEKPVHDAMRNLDKPGRVLTDPEFFKKNRILERYGRGNEPVPSGNGFYGNSSVIFLDPTDEMKVNLEKIRQIIRKTLAYQNGKIKFYPEAGIHHTLVNYIQYEESPVPAKKREINQASAKASAGNSPGFSMEIEGVSVNQTGGLTLQAFLGDGFKEMERSFRGGNYSDIYFNFAVMTEALSIDEKDDLQNTLNQLAAAPVGMKTVDKISFVHHQNDMMTDLLQRNDITLRSEARMQIQSREGEAAQIAKAIADEGFLHLYGRPDDLFQVNPNYSSWKGENIKFHRFDAKGFRPLISINLNPAAERLGNSLQGASFSGPALFFYANHADERGHTNRSNKPYKPELAASNFILITYEPKMENQESIVYKDKVIPSRAWGGIAGWLGYTEKIREAGKIQVPRPVKGQLASMQDFINQNPLLYSHLDSKLSEQKKQERALVIQYSWFVPGANAHLNMVLPESLGNRLADLIKQDPSIIGDLIAQYLPELGKERKTKIPGSAIVLWQTPEKAADWLYAALTAAPHERLLRSLAFTTIARDYASPYLFGGSSDEPYQLVTEAIDQVFEKIVFETGKARREIPAKALPPRSEARMKEMRSFNIEKSTKQKALFGFAAILLWLSPVIALPIATWVYEKNINNPYVLVSEREITPARRNEIKKRLTTAIENLTNEIDGLHRVRGRNGFLREDEWIQMELWKIERRSFEIELKNLPTKVLEFEKDGVPDVVETTVPGEIMIKELFEEEREEKLKEEWYPMAGWLLVASLGGAFLFSIMYWFKLLFAYHAYLSQGLRLSRVFALLGSVLEEMKKTGPSEHGIKDSTINSFRSEARSWGLDQRFATAAYFLLSDGQQKPVSDAVDRQGFYDRDYNEDQKEYKNPPENKILLQTLKDFVMKEHRDEPVRIVYARHVPSGVEAGDDYDELFIDRWLNESSLIEVGKEREQQFKTIEKAVGNILFDLNWKQAVLRQGEGNERMSGWVLYGGHPLRFRLIVMESTQGPLQIKIEPVLLHPDLDKSLLVSSKSTGRSLLEEFSVLHKTTQSPEELGEWLRAGEYDKFSGLLKQLERDMATHTNELDYANRESSLLAQFRTALDAMEDVSKFIPRSETRTSPPKTNPEGENLMKAFREYYYSLSQGDDLAIPGQRPDVFLLIGDHDLEAFIKFSKQWKERFQGTPIVLVGGAQGFPLIQRTLNHYGNKVVLSEESELKRTGMETAALRIILKKEGITSQNAVILVEDEAPTNTGEYFQLSKQAVEKIVWEKNGLTRFRRFLYNILDQLRGRLPGFLAIAAEKAMRYLHPPVNVAVVSDPARLLELGTAGSKEWSEEINKKGWKVLKFETYQRDLRGITADIFKLIQSVAGLSEMKEGQPVWNERNDPAAEAVREAFSQYVSTGEGRLKILNQNIANLKENVKVLNGLITGTLARKGNKDFIENILQPLQDAAGSFDWNISGLDSETREIGRLLSLINIKLILMIASLRLEKQISFKDIVAKANEMEDPAGVIKQALPSLDALVKLHQILSGAPRLSTDKDRGPGAGETRPERGGESIRSEARAIERMLVVEDDEMIRKMTRILIRGVKVINVARNGEEALIMIRKAEEEEGDPYQLVFSDIDMPKMNGIQLVEAAHALYPKTRTIYVLTTGRGHGPETNRLKEAGQILEVLPKPYTLELGNMLARVEAVLAKQEGGGMKPEVLTPSDKNEKYTDEENNLMAAFGLLLSVVGKPEKEDIFKALLDEPLSPGRKNGARLRFEAIFDQYRRLSIDEKTAGKNNLFFLSALQTLREYLSENKAIFDQYLNWEGSVLDGLLIKSGLDVKKVQAEFELLESRTHIIKPAPREGETRSETRFVIPEGGEEIKLGLTLIRDNAPQIQAQQVFSGSAIRFLIDYLAGGVAHAAQSEIGPEVQEFSEWILGAMLPKSSIRLAKWAQGAVVLKPSDKFGALQLVVEEEPSEELLTSLALSLISNTGQRLHIIYNAGDVKMGKVLDIQIRVESKILELKLKTIEDLKGKKIDSRLEFTATNQSNLSRTITKTSGQMFNQARREMKISREAFPNHFVQMFLGKDSNSVMAQARSMRARGTAIGLAVSEKIQDPSGIKGVGILRGMQFSQAGEIDQDTLELLQRRDDQLFEMQTNVLQRFVQALRSELRAVQQLRSAA